jgi:hypothetical protein
MARGPIVLAVLSAALWSGSAPAGAATLRTNQVGYAPGGPKQAWLMSSRALGGARYTVAGPRALHGRISRAHRRWSARWPYVYRIDLSALKRPGTYRIHAGGATATVRVAAPASLYTRLAGYSVRFFQAQRDGPNVLPGLLGRRPSHLSDQQATVYEIPRYNGETLAGPLHPTGTTLDVAGGWFDAGDYLKFTETASFSDVALLFTMRQFGARVGDPAALAAEARFGTDWLMKMWDQQRGVLYEQVGIGDGNGGSVLGDHDLWRLPQRDDGLKGKPARYLAQRPVFAANSPGAPISPNLAGRTAAAFALCAQVFAQSDPPYAQRCLDAGESLYDAAAKSWTGPLAGSVPRSYYSQPEWRADMELAAIELHLSTRALGAPDPPHSGMDDYLQQATFWADQYTSSSRAGQDSLNIYDLSGIAHFDLYREMVATGHTTDLFTNARDVLGDMRDQLRLGRKLGGRDAFGLANTSGNLDPVPHALGYAVESRLYDALVGRPDFERLASSELDWVLGGNAWGASFVVGAGRSFPRCLAHQAANLSGSLTGRGRLLLGAVVDGPTAASNLTGLGAPDGYRRCPRTGAGPYRPFDSANFRYLDSVVSSDTSEPADDYSALGLLAFAQAAAR